MAFAVFPAVGIIGGLLGMLGLFGGFFTGDAVKVRRAEPHRLTRALFGDFTIVLVALRQQGFLVRTQNPSKISPREVPRQFSPSGFVFRQGKARREYYRIVKGFDAA